MSSARSTAANGSSSGSMNSRPITCSTMTRPPAVRRIDVGAEARGSFRIVQRPQQSVLTADVVEDLAAVPGVVAGGDDIDARLIELAADLRGDTEPVGGVFAVDDDEVEFEVPAQLRNAVADRPPAGTTDDVAAEKKLHPGDLIAEESSGAFAANQPVAGQDPVDRLIPAVARHGFDHLRGEADADCKRPSSAPLAPRSAASVRSYQPRPWPRRAPRAINRQQRHQQRVGDDTRAPRPAADGSRKRPEAGRSPGRQRRKTSTSHPSSIAGSAHASPAPSSRASNGRTSSSVEMGQ